MWDEFCRAFRVNADKLAFIAFAFKFDKTVNQSKKRIVFAAPDVFARLPFRAALSRQDVAAEHALAAEFFQPQPLRLRIAPVTRTADSLFMCLNSTLQSDE